MLNWILAAGLAGMLSGTMAWQEGRSLPDPEPFYAATRANVARAQAVQNQFAYRERRTELHLNPFGRMGSGGTVVYDVMPMAGGGVERHLVELAQPALDALSHACHETVNLSVPTPGGVDHLAQVDGRHFLGAGQWVGRRVDYHCTANGKVFLAFGAAELPPGELARMTPTTLVERAALDRQLHIVRREGFATTIDELEVGLSALAAPVRGPRGHVIAALSISGPSLRLTGARIAELAPVLLHEADALSERLGASDQGGRAA